MSCRSQRKKLVEVASGYMKVGIETKSDMFRKVLAHKLADPLLVSALDSVTAVLIEGGHWPIELLETLSDFMHVMKNDVQRDRFM